MISDVGICNIALARVGAEKITDLSEASPAALDCARLYEPLRDALLAAHPWRFAEAHQPLAALADAAPAGWTYAFALPSDCLAARAVVDGQTGPSEQPAPPVPFAVSGATVLTDQAGAVLIYTRRVSDPVRFDPLFADALATKIAADLAMSRRLDRQIRDQMVRDHQMVMAQARLTDARAGTVETTHTPDWLQARS